VAQGALSDCFDSLLARGAFSSMAPKRNTKRVTVSAPPEEPPAKKLATALKKHGVTQGSYRQIADCISHPLAGDLPEDCRNMLLAMLPQSLCTPSDERHEFQTVAVEMIGEVVSKITGALQLALDQETEKVAGVEASKADLEKKLQEAEAAEQEAQTATAQKESELKSASEALQAAKVEVGKKEEEQKQGDAGLVKTKADKDDLETAFAGAFHKLKVGDYEGDAKQLYRELEATMKMVHMDESLKTAAQGVLTKKPAERGAFDSTVTDELEKSYKDKIEELSAAILAGKPESDARAAAVAEAQTALEAVEATQREASNSLCSAKEAQKSAESMVKAAKDAIAEYQPAYKAATELRDAKQHELQTFTDESLASYTELKDRISAKKHKELAAAASKAAKEAEEAQKAPEAAAEAGGEAAEAA